MPDLHFGPVLPATMPCMCCRYLRSSDKRRLIETFHLCGQSNDPASIELPPCDYNVAPATRQPVIRHNRNNGERELVLMRWGLVPQYAKGLKDFSGTSTINARADTLYQKAIWRIPLQRRRCIIPADGFYEWQALLSMTRTNGRRTKRPFAFTMADGQPFAFAGLWSAWKCPENGDWLQSFAIITTEANELMAPVHNRMPVILRSEDYTRWLSRDSAEPLPIDLLRPYPAEAMQTVPCDVFNAQTVSS
ncbi:MAG TPA: SOS response-associated peptidase [Edaphobacter sp.]